MKIPITFERDGQASHAMKEPFWQAGLSSICAIAWLAATHSVRAESAASDVAPLGIKLANNEGHTGEALGWTVATDSGIAVAGARGVPLRIPHVGPGSAYVFVREGSNWIQQTKLTASDAAIDDSFGDTVAVSFQNIVVGAPINDSHLGSAYVFVRNGTNWTEQAKLTAWGRRIDDGFGSSVAIDAETILVGVPNDEGPCPDRHCDTGSAYVFVRQGTNWVHQAKLTASDAADHDSFGSALAINGNTAVVTRLGSGGSAYVFVRNGWTWLSQAKLVGGTPGEGFGASVAIQRDRIIVGATSLEGSNSGDAYVFERKGTNWMQTAKLHASDADAYRYFGYSVALSGNQALVGSPGSGVFLVGAAYLFEHDGTAWREQAILSTNTTMGTESLAPPIGTVTFGRSVSFQGGTALVGHPTNSDGCPPTAPVCNKGAAFVFPLSMRPTVNLHRIDPTASEPGADTAQFKVTRFGNTDDALRVFYEVNGTATPGIDYTPLRGFATIAPGETSALFKVKPIDDNDPEEPETVYVSLLPDPAYDRVRPFRANITIADDD